MKIGDLVKNLNSESRMTGIIIGWHQAMATADPTPLVLWADGRCNWIVLHRVEVVNASR
jgi:hypothetical protein